MAVFLAASSARPSSWGADGGPLLPASLVQPLHVYVGIINNTCWNNDVNCREGEGLDDPRAAVFGGVAQLLQSRGHTVELADAADRPADLAIVPWFWPRPAGVGTVLVYENGFIRGSVTVDPSGLLGDSYYISTLNREVQSYDEASCSTLVTSLRNSDSSKRPQPMSTSDLLPTTILGRYIFVPTQKADDLSVTRYSNATMAQLIDSAIAFGKAYQLPVVFKVHPALEASEGEEQRSLILRLASAHGYPVGDHTFLSRADIHYLMAGARFTVTINGGTMFDNFVTQTPVLSIGRSLFAETDAVVYDWDLQHGLGSMLRMGEWNEERRRRQRQVVCWTHANSLNAAQPAEENLVVLQRHLSRVAPQLRL